MRFLGLLIIAAGVVAAAMSLRAIAQPTNLGPFQHTLSVGTTAVMAAVPSNPTRRGLLVCNVAAAGTLIYVTFGPGTVSNPNTPSVTNGVPIPGGAVVNSCLNLLPWSAANIGMGAQLNFIASAAATPVVVLEF